MNRISKGILLGVGLSLLLLLVAALSLRAALKSDSTRQRIQESLSRSLQMDVRFEKLRPTFFKGSRLTNLNASREGGSCLSAKEVFVRPRLLSLIRGQFVLSEIRVEDAHLVLVEYQKTQAQTVSDAKTHAVLIKNGRPRLAIRRLTLHNAAFDWIDSKGKYKAQVQGIELDTSHPGEDGGYGNLSISNGTVFETLPFKDLTAPIHITGTHYNLPAITCSSGGGSITAQLDLAPADQDLPFTLAATASEIDLGKISQEIPSVRSTGIVHGKLAVSGLLKKPETLVGQGDFSLENGVIKGLHVLQSIGQIFQISELANFKVKKAVAQFSIANRKITLQNTLIDGGDLLLSAPGEIDFDQQIKLNAKLALPEKMLTGKVMQMFNERFSAPDETGRRFIEFHVTGSTEKPKTDLLEKLVGNDLGGVINKLLGGFLKPRSKSEATPPKETPAPEPPPSK